MTSDNIIFFREFDSVIDANIAKTKLDAYGVPCFLTGENMSNLYPGQPFLPVKVRLHLFSKDLEGASMILSDVNLIGDHDHSVNCPRCQSGRTIRDFPKKFADSLKFIFFGVLFPKEKVNHCLDCNHEF
jgi:hypothetical protein